MGDLLMFAGECDQSVVLQEVRRIVGSRSMHLQYLDCNLSSTRDDMLALVQRGAAQNFSSAVELGHDVAVCAISPPRKKRSSEGTTKVMPTVWAAVKGPESAA